ncbi:hypothetical protein EQG49_00465 [Periweissella cryptocerci]|uniref:Uncharacterized protein n=1 Tax=Periweissella cryptocerci TaxID=2506420 RepID=A0A4P6YQY4_9LACO|nr:hypothetical protein [Periweissella cryptocerci]QBO35027.1 hypothetical protein EQG49_00465 [Periweissella cryptocerci]
MTMRRKSCQVFLISMLALSLVGCAAKSPTTKVPNDTRIATEDTQTSLEQSIKQQINSSLTHLSLDEMTEAISLSGNLTKAPYHLAIEVPMSQKMISSPENKPLQLSLISAVVHGLTKVAAVQQLTDVKITISDKSPATIYNFTGAEIIRAKNAPFGPESMDFLAKKTWERPAK